MPHNIESIPFVVYCAYCLCYVVGAVALVIADLRFNFSPKDFCFRFIFTTLPVINVFAMFCFVYLAMRRK